MAVSPGRPDVSVTVVFKLTTPLTRITHTSPVSPSLNVSPPSGLSNPNTGGGTIYIKDGQNFVQCITE